MKYPTANRCPECGCEDFIKVNDATEFTLLAIRECDACDTRYIPPAPVWLCMTGIWVSVLCFVISAVGLVCIRYEIQPEPSVLTSFPWIAIGLGGITCLAVSIRQWINTSSAGAD